MNKINLKSKILLSSSILSLGLLTTPPIPVLANTHTMNYQAHELENVKENKIIKELPKISDKESCSILHLVYEKDGKQITTTVPLTKSTSEQTKVANKIAQELPKTNSEKSIAISLISVAVLSIGTIFLIKTKKGKMLLVLLVGSSTLATGYIANAQVVENVLGQGQVSYSLNEYISVGKIDGYKYIGYYLEETSCTVPIVTTPKKDVPMNKVPNKEIDKEPKEVSKIPNSYPVVDLPVKEIEITPNTPPTVDLPTAPIETVPPTAPSVELPIKEIEKLPNDFPSLELPNANVPRGSVIVKYVDDSTNQEIKENLVLKDNVPSEEAYSTKKVPEIDKGDFVYKLLENKLPSNANGKVIENTTTEVIYRYEKVIKKGSVIVEYLVKGTNEKLKEDLILIDNQNAGTNYSSERLNKINSNNSNYELSTASEDLPKNENGLVEANKTIKVTYLYNYVPQPAPEVLTPDVPYYSGPAPEPAPQPTPNDYTMFLYLRPIVNIEQRIAPEPVYTVRIPTSPEDNVAIPMTHHIDLHNVNVKLYDDETMFTGPKEPKEFVYKEKEDLLPGTYARVATVFDYEKNSLTHYYDRVESPVPGGVVRTYYKNINELDSPNEGDIIKSKPELQQNTEVVNKDGQNWRYVKSVHNAQTRELYHLYEKLGNVFYEE